MSCCFTYSPKYGTCPWTPDRWMSRGFGIGALTAVGAVPEVDGVQVGGEDLVLRPLLLQLPRERRLFQLPEDRALVAGQRVLHELLRDRRAALHGASADVVPERATEAADIHRAVLVEALVLRRDDRLLHPRRDLVGLHEDAALRPAQDGQDGVAVRGVDVAVHLLPPLMERIEAAQLLADRDDDAVRERRHGQDAEDGDERQQTELANPAPAMFAQRHGRAGF